MKKSKLEEHLREQPPEFRSQFKRVKKGKDVEDVNQMRATMSRWGALLSLMEFATKRKFKKKRHDDLFSDLFSKAEKVGENQVNIDLIEDLNGLVPESYKAYLQERQKSQEKRLIREMSRFDFEKLEKADRSLLKSLRDVSDREAVRASTRYITRELKRLGRMRSGVSDDLELSRVRTRLRKLSAVLGLMRNLDPEGHPKSSYKALKKLNESIRVWHDHVMLIESLRDFGGQVTHKKSMRAMRQLLDELQEKCDGYRIEVTSGIVTYLESTPG